MAILNFGTKVIFELILLVIFALTALPANTSDGSGERSAQTILNLKYQDDAIDSKFSGPVKFQYRGDRY